MIVALHDADKLGKPNLALMKLSAYHKSHGHTVEWFYPIIHGVQQSEVVIYSSKIFTWTPEDRFLPQNTIKGGTGYQMTTELPWIIEHTNPDYTLYGINYGLGFLTRGCPNNCAWCVVPKKEGPIRRHMDVEDLLNARSKDMVLMDNNVLACEHGMRQIMKIGRLGLRVDFNQGLDSRLIDADVARRLSRLRWLKPVRLACDHKEQMPYVESAVRHLRAANVTPKSYSCYVLVRDVADAHERVNFLLSMGVDPFAQPYRDWKGTAPTKEQRDFATWVNRHYCKVVPWEQYDPKKRYGAKAT